MGEKNYIIFYPSIGHLQTNNGFIDSLTHTHTCVWERGVMRNTTDAGCGFASGNAEDMGKRICI